MATAANLRAEASRIRAFALTVTDADTLAALQEMAEELEARARKAEEDDGGV